MAHSKFPAEVLTPEGEVFSEDVEMLSTFTTEGSIAILANHQPILARLEPTELRLYRAEGEIVRFAQAEGYLQFAENRALVLVEEAIAPDEIDRSTFETKLSQARQAAERAPEDSEERARGLRDAKRYEAFLAVGS
jgi:F-type H+-transporting ATPase subunit epsilon